MPRKTNKQAYVAGYTKAIQDLVDRNAVSWKYTDFTKLAEMVKLAGESHYEVWKDEEATL